MTRVDPTRNIRHALRTLLPARPEMKANGRLVRFFVTLLGSLFVTILSLNLLVALDASKGIRTGVALAWMFLLIVGSPIVFFLRARDGDRLRQEVGRWLADPRRLAAERLFLDLSAGRVPPGMVANDLVALDAAAGDWRGCHEALAALEPPASSLRKIRDDLLAQADHAMLNVLAEAGAGSTLGVSPFAIERARSLFVEIASEANAIARSQSGPLRLPTDHSIEALRYGLDRLREARRAEEELRGR